MMNQYCIDTCFTCVYESLYNKCSKFPMTHIEATNNNGKMLQGSKKNI